MLTAAVGNDLRMLLGVMVKSLEALRSRVTPDGDYDQDLAELEGAIDGAYYLCRQLLSPHNGDNGETRTLDVNELVMEASGVLQRLVGPAIRLCLNLTATSAIVVADAIPLECALLNLAANAREAMPDGGTLSIETSSISVKPAPRQDPRPYVRLTVSDTGRGLKTTARTRAFEPFFTTNNGHAGLGLTSVMATVQRLGGFVELESTTDAGTRAHVCLPALVAVAPRSNAI